MDKKKIIDYMKNKLTDRLNLMIVSSIQNYELKRHRIDKLLLPNVNLLTGPLSPVCVMNTQFIDLAIGLLENNKTIFTFNDILNIKGRNYSLKDYQKKGYRVYVINSPLDLFPYIENHPYEEIVFVGVGFETIVPVLASTIKSIKMLGLKNISFLLSLRNIKALLIYLLNINKTVDGIIAPGHIAIITGSDYFNFVTDYYKLSCAVCGYSALDILTGIYFLIRHTNNPQFINLYGNVASPKGNKKAMGIISQVFELKDAYFFNIGKIKQSAYYLKDEYREYDAFEKYRLRLNYCKDDVNCHCTDVLLGMKKPKDCPFFNYKCSPITPLGPCMSINQGHCFMEI